MPTLEHNAFVDLRAKKRCPACVLVVAPDRAVAAWAAERINLGLGRGTLGVLSDHLQCVA
jgi:hypothetical protein